MIREILRAVGIRLYSCRRESFISPLIVRFLSDNDSQQLQTNVEKLQSELAKTKELLATAQTTSSVKE